MERHKIDFVLRMFPGLFKVVASDLYFKDQNISKNRYECVSIYVSGNNQVHNIQAVGTDMGDVYIRFSINDQWERENALMILPRGMTLPDETLISLFEIDIDVKYSPSKWGNIEDVYRLYDRTSIMRRHIIKNIIDI